MHGNSAFCLALLCATAVSAGTVYGVNYTGTLATSQGFQRAVDGSGSLYLLAACVGAPGADILGCLNKVSPDGKTVVWSDTLGFWASAIAVDSVGNVYLASNSTNPQDTSPSFVEKMSVDGKAVLWKTTLSSGLTPFAISLDSAGHVYVAGENQANNTGFLARFNSGGTLDYTVSLDAPGYSISMERSGSLFVETSANEVAGVERLEPDGTVSWAVDLSMFDSRFPSAAADQNGNVWVFGEGTGGGKTLLRLDANGNQTFAQTITSDTVADVGFPLAVDSAGNAIIVGYSASLIPTTNNVATCEGGSSWFSVYASDGSLVQTSYAPIVARGTITGITVGSNSIVYLTGYESAGSVITRLSPSANPEFVPLTCMGSAATYDTGSIAPGEIVTLFGSGLGPVAGIQTQATLASPFPTHTGDVEVTFDGIPSPLLWVQDRQVNVAVPWSLTPGQTTQVCVVYQSSTTNCLTWPVVQTAPGVFTVDGTYGAAVNEDGTINSASNPARSGSVVSVFATGMGPLSPPQADGSLVALPLPVNQIPVGGSYLPDCDPLHCVPLPLTIDYAGPAPFELAGLTQINIHVPPVTASDRYPSAGQMSVFGSYQSFRVYVAPQ